MRRFLTVLVTLLFAVIALPPLYFRIFPVDPIPMPAPGQRVVVRDGIAVNAVVKGDGPPVVLVHGLPGSAYDWAAQGEALASRGFRVYAYDRVGYGHSDPRPDGDFSVAANALDLLGLLESQDLRDATVVGWSYGGPVSIEAAGRDASRIGRLVLVGSGGPTDEADKPPAALGVLYSKPVLDWLGAVPPVGRGVQRMLSRQAFSEGPQPAWWLPLVAANFGTPHTRHTYQQEVASVSEGDMSIDPLTVGVPILLIHGNDDRMVPVAVAEWIKSHARRAELEVIEGGSHMLPVTHADLLADRIARFIRGS
jgi:pimeloyl-ACP methyl ester carboxylesterase